MVIMDRVIPSPSVNSVSGVLQENKNPLAPDVCSECASLTIAFWPRPVLFTQLSPHQGSNIPTWRQKCLGGCVKNLDKAGDISLLSPHPQICFFDKYLATSLVNHGKFSKSMVNLLYLFSAIILPFLSTPDFRKDVLHDFLGDWRESEQLVISQNGFSLFENSCCIWGLSWLSGPSPSLQNLSHPVVKSLTISSAGSFSTLEWHPPSGLCLGSDFSGDPNSLLSLTDPRDCVGNRIKTSEDLS